MRDQIIDDLKKALEKLGITGVEPLLEHPAQESHGDYSSNAAMILFKKNSPQPSLAKRGSRPPSPERRGEGEVSKNPLDLAQMIVDSFPKTDYLEKIEVAPPGFVNLWLKTGYFGSQLAEVLKKGGAYGEGEMLKTKKIMVEYGDPNTHKAFHIGHLRNISLGESVVRLLEKEGAKVVHASYQGDVGMHIAKCLYGFLHHANLLSQIATLKDKRERVNLIARAYTEGSRAFEEDENSKKEMALINKQIYARDRKIWDLYQTTRQWSLDYFEEIYQRLGNCYDKQYFESQVYESGKEKVLKGLKKGIFIESEGAVIFPGEKFGLHNRVFITGEGNPTYEGKDMGLGPLQYQESGKDFVIRVVGPEQAGYFQVVFEAQSQLFPELRGKFYHLPSGWVKLKKGKMSSRTGQVILGEWLLDEVKKKLQESYKMTDETAEIVAVGAVKYSMLKVSVTQEMAFDIDESINLEGDSGPYLQYTYARCKSVLGKASRGTPPSGEPQEILKQVQNDDKKEIASLTLAMTPAHLASEELSILRTLYKFPEVVEEAAKNYAPNLICSYLFDLSQKYNLFYNKHSILDPEENSPQPSLAKRGSLPSPERRGQGEVRDFRLALTAAVGQIIKNGLYLLGIKVVEKM